MKKLLLFGALFFASIYYSQQQRFCGTEIETQKWLSKNSTLQSNFDHLQQQASDIGKQQLKNSYQNTQSVIIYTIPVVFHILHTGGSENISDAQINDAISILNRDYRKLNADTNVVVTEFKNLIADIGIQYSLAAIDPNGNCTNGIIRHWDLNTDWTSGAFINYIYTWPPSMYLNVYVVKTISSGAAGYTYVPGSGIPTNADAIVILSNYVGSIGSSSPYVSRALTHEVGHWLNLRHTWGATNQPGVACGDDGVSDTPITKGFTSCNLSSAAICNAGIVENVQNYMDYSYCSKMFTIGQATRMRTAITNSINNRNNLITASNYSLTGLTSTVNNCIPLLEISAPTNTTCVNNSLAFSSYTSNALPTTYSWSATNGAIIANPSSNNTSISFPNIGSSIVTCVASNSNGASSKTLTVNAVNGTANINTINSEDFEASLTVLPNNWQTLNPNSMSPLWQLTNIASASGFNSIYVAGENLPPSGIEILETPSYNFQANPGASYSFKCAYARYSNTFTDLFKVQASDDCGGSWKDIFVPSVSSLASGSGGVSSTAFIPNNAQWKTYTVTSMPAFNSMKTKAWVKFRFYFQSDLTNGYGNRIYLDDINFNSSSVGINELSEKIALKIYPTPASDKITLSFNLLSQSNIEYSLTNILGSRVLDNKLENLKSGENETSINIAPLAGGIYFINLKINGFITSQKIVIEH
ncbi:MAG: zinc-dependent metalloprotease [Bacteroidetes bacterium]|nr:zinc-dependent metalloprotease [Bacteroidota bacterium]